MATGSAKFLPRADLVVVLSANGTIAGQGSFQELCAAENNATKFITSVDTGSEAETTPASTHEAKPTNAGKTRMAEGTSKPDDKRLDSSRQNGDFGIYKYYFTCISWTVVAIFLLLQFAYAFLCTFPSEQSDTSLEAVHWLTETAVWLKWWADANMQVSHSPYGYYIGIYTALQLGALALSAAVTW
jgi:ATP-binding cassette subfamily C (CFTR/MRP) protein 1